MNLRPFDYSYIQQFVVMRQVGKRFIFVKLDCCRYGSPVATGSKALIIPFHLQDLATGRKY
jgi:hypothetical protein